MCQMKMLKSLCYSKKHQFLLELLSDAYSRTIFSNVATLLDFFPEEHNIGIWFISYPSFIKNKQKMSCGVKCVG